jgi:hypothetical protein
MRLPRTPTKPAVLLVCATGLAALAPACAAPGPDGSGGGGDTADEHSGAADSGAADSGGPDEPAPTPFNGCTAPEGRRAAGTFGDPLRAATLPFTDAASTVDAPDDTVTAYDCAPDTREAGPGRWYAFTLDAPREVRIEVSDGAGVDVDVHLLRDPRVEDGLARGCVDRDDTHLVRTLDAGTWWVAVDTWAASDGTEYPGDYRLSLEAWEDGAWTEVAVTPGLTWRHFQVGGDAPRRVDALLLDPARVALAPTRHDGCEPVDTVAARVGARAGINAAFYDEACEPRTFLRVDGQTLATPDLGSEQRAALWDEGMTPTYRWLAAGEDDTSATHGIGSYPSLRTGGADAVDPTGDSSFYTARHPRTAFGTLEDGRVAWVVVDGRSTTASGVTLDELAALLGEIGLVDAVNLDGGGSSTLYLEGCSATGILNFPSDGGGDAHDGARAVADGVYAWVGADSR